MILKRIRSWLRHSSRIHIREHRVWDRASLVGIVDRFLDDCPEYPLEWDDFVSWEHDDPLIEAYRARIGELESLVISREPAREREGLERMVAIRNDIASQCGIGARPVPEVRDLIEDRWSGPDARNPETE